MTQISQSGFSLEQSVLAPTVGANTALVCDPLGRFVITAWCGRLDLWGFDPSGHIQGFGFPVQQGDARPDLPPELLPPFAGSSPAECWPAQLLPVTAVSIASSGSFVTVAAGAEVRTLAYSQERQELYESGRLAADGSLLLGAALSADDRTLAAISVAGNLMLWNLAEGRRSSLQPLPAPASAICFRADGSIVIGDSKGVIHLWDSERGRSRYSFDAHEGSVHTISDANGRLVSAGADHTVTVWSPEKLGSIYDSFQHRSHVSSFQVHGDTLVSASFDGYLAFWSLSEATLIGWQHLGEPVYLVSASADGEKLIAATAKSIRLLQVPAQGLVSDGVFRDWPHGLSVYRAVDEQNDTDEVLDLGMPEDDSDAPSGSEVALSYHGLPPEADDEDMLDHLDDSAEVEQIRVSHSGVDHFQPDGATQPAGITAPGAPSQEDSPQAGPARDLPPEAFMGGESDPMDGVLLHSSDVPAVEQAMGVSLPTEGSGQLIDGIGHLLNPTELIIATLIGVVSGGLAWVILFATDEQREVWVSGLGGVAAALTVFAGAMLVMVIRRIRRFNL